MSIQKIEIDMLNVGAADAILIHCITERNLDYIILVDAGNEGDGQKILDHINSYYSQKYIDIAICTHPDDDHYGGFKELLNEHMNEDSDFKIRDFWILDPAEHISTEDVKRIRKQGTLKARARSIYNFNDGTNLLDLIDECGIDILEPFAETTHPILDIEVLGPDMDYYESLVPAFRFNNLHFHESEDENEQRLTESTTNEQLSRTLDEAIDDNSPHNQSSVVFTIKCNDKLFLFAGDAGSEALNRIKGKNPNAIRDVYWFKVPHHGSKHNLQSKLIQHINPKVSFISTLKYGKYLNRCTVNALKKSRNSSSKVFSTHINDNSSWIRENIDMPRDNTQNATSL